MKKSAATFSIIVLALAGCGGGESTPTETVTVEVTPTPEESASQPAALPDVETAEPAETEAEETSGDAFADNADYEAHRSDILTVMVPIWGESTANDMVHGEDSVFTDEGLRQMCVIWQSGVTVTSEDESDANMKQVYLTTGANDARAAALVSSLKENVCSK